jgi:putative inorganic carbon (hco3(-)) transporter
MASYLRYRSNTVILFQKMVFSRWFAFADLVCASISSVLWEMDPHLGLLPLLIALLPWLLRVFAGRFPFKRTPFDFPILIFLLTAFIGIFTAFNPENAWAKFWLIVSGVLLYYTYAGQPKENTWTIAGYISFIGVALATFFLFTNNWEIYPAKVGFLNQIGLWWMKIRPATNVVGTHPNNAAGVIGFILPFLIAIGIRAWKEKRILSGLWAVVGGIPMVVAFIMATSRGASLALIAGLGIWFVWGGSHLAARFIHQKAKTIFISALILIGILSAGITLSFPGGLESLFNSLNGLPIAMSRLDLANSSLRLVGDFSITGAGLNTFPGLFSQYILNSPNYFILYSHNFYLDIALEQGFIGLLAFCTIHFGSIWMALSAGWKKPGALLVWAALAGLIVAALHGLVDNVLYGPNDAPILFWLPGLAFAMIRASSQENHLVQDHGNIKANRFRKRPIIWGILASVIMICIMTFSLQKPILGAWYANLGSIRMAQVDLVDFPWNSWNDGRNIDKYQESKAYFLIALANNPFNHTANYRLGLIAMLGKDFPAAVTYLESAYAIDKDHRGVTKSLGYSYVWIGQYALALPLLQKIPESQQEMETYTWWWTTQNRPDLSANAALMASQLKGASSHSST